MLGFGLASLNPSPNPRPNPNPAPQSRLREFETKLIDKQSLINSMLEIAGRSKVELAIKEAQQQAQQAQQAQQQQAQQQQAQRQQAQRQQTQRQQTQTQTQSQSTLEVMNGLLLHQHHALAQLQTQTQSQAVLIPGAQIEALQQPAQRGGAMSGGGRHLHEYDGGQRERPPMPPPPSQ